MAEVVVTTIVAPNPGPFTLDGSRSYVLEGEVVIDPGPDIGSHVEAVLAAAPRLQAIFITHGHADHAPAAAALKSRTGAAVHAPPGVLTDIANQHLADGAIWTFGSFRLEAIATPGHTPEHFCFLTAGGDLFSGDTVLGEGTTAVSPPEGNMRAYMESLQRLRDRAPRASTPAMGPCARMRWPGSTPTSRIAASARSRSWHCCARGAAPFAICGPRSIPISMGDSTAPRSCRS